MTYTRAEALDILMENTKEAMIDDAKYFESVLLHGFAGFEDCSNEELKVMLEEYFEDRGSIVITD